MTAQKISKQLRLREWAKQIAECEHSGMPIGQWCDENGIGYKNYYYRRRRVREEYIDSVGAETALALSKSSLVESNTPTFTELPVKAKTETYGTAATVEVGRYIAEIRNGADMETIAGLLRTLSCL